MTTCKNCHYYEPDQNIFGFCRRFPPVGILEGSFWSRVKELDWCGEFKCKGCFGLPLLEEVNGMLIGKLCQVCTSKEEK